MLCGLGFYLRFRPRYLAGIGEAPPRAPEGPRAPAQQLTGEERDRLTALLVIMVS